MIHDILTQTANSIWAQIGLVISVLVFSAISVWTYAGKKNRFDRESRLPLEDDAANHHLSDPHK